jgi:hypothetical protein
VFDFSGIAMTHLISEMQFHSSAVKFGSFFDPSLPALTLPTVMWTNEMILIRCATAGLAALLLIPAGLCFHRYSPDKIKVAHTQKRRSMVSLINGWIQPVSVVVRPMFSVSAKLPLFWGQIIADIALTLVTSPLAVVLLIASLVATFTVDATQLPVLLGVSGLVWGILVSEVSTRDYQAACEEMTGTVIGGGTRRYLRQFAAAFGLGLLFTGAIGLRLAIDDPQRAATLFIGLFSLSALATLFGRCSRTTSMFTAVFLAWLYVAISMRVVPIVDVLGFNGVANTNTVLVQLAIGAAATAIGYLYNTKQGR